MGVALSAGANQVCKVTALSLMLAACATTSTGTMPLRAMVPEPVFAATALTPVTPALQLAQLDYKWPEPLVTADRQMAAQKPRKPIVIQRAEAPKPDVTAALAPAPKTIARPEAKPAEPVAPSAPAVAGMALGGAVPAPMGFTAFCVSYPHACAATPNAAKTVALESSRLAELEAVNARVNEAIWPAADDYDADVWSIAPEAGDCDDYAVTKREQLIAMGYPPAALLLTTARTERGERHLVLVVSTDSGDLVLDNRTDAIRDWRDVRYTWEARQSSINPKIWQAVQQRPAEFAAAN